MENYSKYIDSTVLTANATKEQIYKLCKEAISENFFSVCINPFYVNLAKQILKDSDIKVCTVVGFPLGQNTISTKVFETLDAIKNGADEIDMVINITRLKENDFKYCVTEINEITKAAQGRIVKVIVETALLTEEDKINACHIILNSKADFIKTSTGFSTSGAKLEDIKLFDKIIKRRKFIKAAGGIKNHAELLEFVEAGVDRIGTSKGKELMKKD